MNQIAKSIACLSMTCTLFACEEKAATASTKSPDPIPQEKTQKKQKELTPFEIEIQKMLEGEKGDEVILSRFLKGKPKKNNAGYVKKGLDHYVITHGKRPNKKLLIDTLIRLNRINVEMRNEESLERIKKKLADQLKKEQGQ